MTKQQPSEKNYQQLKTELNDILEKLQSEEVEVDEAIELHKQGKKVLTELESYLKKVGADLESK